jgi:hypothetical protein
MQGHHNNKTYQQQGQEGLRQEGLGYTGQVREGLGYSGQDRDNLDYTQGLDYTRGSGNTSHTGRDQYGNEPSTMEKVKQKGQEGVNYVKEKALDAKDAMTGKNTSGQESGHGYSGHGQEGHSYTGQGQGYGYSSQGRDNLDYNRQNVGGGNTTYTGREQYGTGTQPSTMEKVKQKGQEGVDYVKDKALDAKVAMTGKNTTGQGYSGHGQENLGYSGHQQEGLGHTGHGHATFGQDLRNTGPEEFGHTGRSHDTADYTGQNIGSGNTSYVGKEHHATGKEPSVIEKSMNYVKEKAHEAKSALTGKKEV